MNAAGSIDALSCAVTRILQWAPAISIPVAATAALSAALLGAGDATAATLTVASNADSGPGSLREAIGLANASAGNTVQFDATLKGSTITLTTGFIVITKPMTIQGLGASQLTISGNNYSRIFKSYADSSDYLNIRDVTLVHGSAGAVGGGAIYATGSRLVLSGVTVAASSTTSAGGGVFAYLGTVRIENSVVTGNNAAYYGGGVEVLDAALTMYRTTVSHNTAGAYGGGVFVSSCATPCSLFINKSTISGNIIPNPQGPVNVGGGGIAVKQSTSSNQLVVESTIASNYAFDFGGGIAMLDASSGSHLYVARTTIAGNSSAGSAGNGISVFNGVTATLQSTIVAGNVSAAGASDLAGSFYLHGSLVEAPDNATIVSGGQNLFGLDPQLGPFGDHGGLTWTMVPAAGSPAIDTSGDCLSGISTDQRGFEGCVNGHIDMGAVERQNPEDIVFRDGFNTS